MAFKVGNQHAKKKGMADYRASLTRSAYERNREKCEKVMQSIIDGAAKLDPVCLKIFASSYMTKAPVELLSHQQSEGTHVLMGEILQEMLVSPKKASRETIDFILDIHRTVADRKKQSQDVEPIDLE